MFERRAAPEDDADENNTAEEEESNDPDSPPYAPPLADPKRGLLVSLKDFWDSVRILVFVLGSAAILIIAASNTISWYLQRFWGASGDFWQRHWEKIHAMFGGNDFLMVVVGSGMVANVLFWVLNGFFMVLDVYEWPKGLHKYKIQRDKNVPLDREKLSRVVKYVLMNQFVVGIPFSVIMFYLYKWRGCDFGPTLPTFHRVLFELLVFAMVEEFGFYYSHRLFHHPFLYKHIHKIHHEWKAPIGVRSIYAHPVEHIISNMLAAAAGPLLAGSHIATATFWFCLAFFSTTIAHCGYHFPFLPSPESHDYHHLKFNENFGVMGILDRFHGTDTQFRKSVQYKRHFYLTTFTPVTETFPDTKTDSKRRRSCSPDKAE